MKRKYANVALTEKDAENLDEVLAHVQEKAIEGVRITKSDAVRWAIAIAADISRRAKDGEA